MREQNDHGVWNQTKLGQHLAPLYIGSVTLSELLVFSELQFQF